MSSNLPPGCSVNDIPGNRPEDEREEAFWDAWFNEAERHEITIPSEIDAEWGADPFHWLSRLIIIARDLGYSEGFGDGQQEAQMAQMAEECIRCGYAHSVQSPCVVD